MNGEFELGKTIVGVRGRSREVELERIAKRKRIRRRNGLIWGVIILSVTGLVTWGVIEIVRGAREVAEGNEAVVSWAPTVEIVSEGGGTASERIREFVAKLERDFEDLGMKIDRVVLPVGMSREIDVYIEGRGEYYKLSIDRGSAVQAEDAGRMMRYLEGVGVEYVDLRVEGKAFYK